MIFSNLSKQLPVNRRGFALIISLSLMSFLLLILIALASSLRIQVSNSRTALSESQARENALLSLSIALSEVQKNLGPDVRVSARAEILDANPNDLIEVSGVNNPYWTGVWDEQGDLMTWLVSGNEGGAPLVWDAVGSSLVGDNALAMVSVGATGDNEVLVPLSPIPNNGGSFAYWVADEGIKAKINLTQSDSPIPNANLISAQRFGLPVVEDLEWFPHTDTTTIQQLQTLSQLNLMPGAPPLTPGSDFSSRYIHHLTSHSHGVLTNSKDGGLKRDLTFGLFNAGSVDLTGDIFPSFGASGFPLPDDPGGPAWNQLRSWLQAPLADGSLPVRRADNEVAGFYPVLSSFRLYMIPSYDPATYRVNIHLMPSVVLWNPYDTPLAVEDYSVKIGRSRAGSTFHHTRNLFFYGPTDVPGGTSHGWVIQLRNDPDDPESTALVPLWNVLEPVVFHIPNVSLAPGEAVVFSPPSGHTPYEWPSQAGSMTMDANRLEPGFRPQWSFYYPLPYDPPLGQLTLDEDGAEWPGFDEYILYQFNQSRIIGINFSQGTVDNPIHLMDIVHLTTQNPLAPPPEGMLPFPGGFPFTNAQRQSAPGLFFQRQYVDNSIIVDPSRLRARNQWLAHHNPRAATQGSNPFFYTLPAGGAFGYNANPSNNPSFISFADRFNDNQGITELAFPANAVPVGLSETSSIPRAILFETPPSREELHSIGQIQHAPLYRWNPFWQSLGTDTNKLRDRMNRARYDNLIPTYAVGNSLADPKIPLGEVRVQWPAPSSDPGLWGVSGWHYDYSYLLNENLWDPYFFSTMPATPAGTIPVPENQRFLVLPHDPAETPSDLSTSAANLLLKGAFNVNSTSIEAWKALLASFWQQEVTLANGSEIPEDDGSPFLRFNQPLAGPVDSGSPTDPRAYEGYRSLDQGQIEALAREIVRQVKLRGPFTSLADFVNRSLDASDNDLRRAGAIAAALARAGINEALEEDYPAITTGDAFPGGVTGLDAISESGWRTSNLPGWLTQADILSRIGNVLTVRSDTFLIRSYGDSTNPITGEVLARARVEAVVQRKPHFVERFSIASGGDSPETALEDLSQQINVTFGRKFELISFQWIDEQEL